MSEGKRKWISFDEVIKECRETRAWKRGKQGKEVLEIDVGEEGIRVVASPGEGSRAYESSADWWRTLEDRAMEESRE